MPRSCIELVVYTVKDARDAGAAPVSAIYTGNRTVYLNY